MAEIALKGITWGHSRGYTPLAAAAQRFGELHPGVKVIWEKRSLQQFADYPVERLTDQYDLLVIDHPWVGRAASLGCVLPLEEWLPDDFLRDQALQSVGYSHQSYAYGGHQWALAIDAATPAASFRPDLLERGGRGIPQTWEEVMEIARLGRLAVPAIPIDLLMNFYMFCIASGERPFQQEDSVVSGAAGRAALETMKDLYALVDERMFTANPIAVAEWMTTGDEFWYCPFAYGYSNYCRTGYADRVLQYADLVAIGDRGRLRSTIGGTGLAVSSVSPHREEAVAFARMVAGPVHQASFYVEHGGQPGHRGAWTSDRANRLTNNFFYTLLPTMERGYTRPRYDGYLHFQDHAGDALQDYLRGVATPAAALDKMNLLYRESKRGDEV
ncbi:MAG TPA: extracellular solute-binding protein [Puia sp.]|nr:extracellular solute-binding protein [Puia sp.]